MTPLLVFVESSTTMGAAYFHAARRLGVRPVLLAANVKRYPFAGAEVVETVQVDTADRAAVVRACRTLATGGVLRGIMSTSDYFLEAAADAARELGLTGIAPNAIAQTRNKHDQRRILGDAGIPSPAFRFCLSPDEVLAAAAHMPLPLVVKPVDGSGSIGVRLCRSFSELREHAATLSAVRTNERGLTAAPGMMLEEYVAGPEYSAEVVGGRVVAMVRKHLGPPPAFVEVGHDVPADLEQVRTAPERTILAAIAALGLGSHPAHVEFRVRGKIVIPIEVNPRVAGGCIPLLVALATGVDLVEQAVRLACGLSVALQARRGMPASVRFVTSAREGAVVGVHGITEARAIAGVREVAVYCQVGDALIVRGDYRDRVGHVIAAAESVTAARRAADRARDTIALEVA